MINAKREALDPTKQSDLNKLLKERHELLVKFNSDLLKQAVVILPKLTDFQDASRDFLTKFESED